MSTRQRRLIIRSALVLFWIGIAALIFVLDRGHTLLVDNRDAADGSYEAVSLMKVRLDGKKAIEFLKGDRDKIPVVGAKHKIRVEFIDGRQPVEREFKLPLGTDIFLLSVPKMLAGIEPFVEPFVMEVVRARDADSSPSSEVGSPSDDEGAAPTAP